MHKDLPDSAVAALLGVAGEAVHRRKVSCVCVCVRLQQQEDLLLPHYKWSAGPIYLLITYEG